MTVEYLVRKNASVYHIVRRIRITGCLHSRELLESLLLRYFFVSSFISARTLSFTNFVQGEEPAPERKNTGKSGGIPTKSLFFSATLGKKKKEDDRDNFY